MPSLFHKHFHLAKSRSFYVVHHFGFLDSLLNSEEHCLRKCNLDRLLPRSDTMAEREPLLPRQNRPAHQHSIFQLVCHSPWYYIGQRSLLFARSFLALYLSAVLGLAVYYECTPGHRRHAKLFPFYGSTISFAIQVIYYWIAAVCCQPKGFLICSQLIFKYRSGRLTILLVLTPNYLLVNRPRAESLRICKTSFPFLRIPTSTPRNALHSRCFTPQQPHFHSWSPQPTGCTFFRQTSSQILQPGPGYFNAL